MCGDDSDDCSIIKIIGDCTISRIKKEVCDSDNELEDEVGASNSVPNGDGPNIFIQDEFFAIINSEHDEKHKKEQLKRRKKEVQSNTVPVNVQENPEAEESISQPAIESFGYENEQTVPTLSLPESSEGFLLDAFPCYSIVQCSDDLNAVLDTGQEPNLNQICTELEPFLAFSQKTTRCESSIAFDAAAAAANHTSDSESASLPTPSIIINVDRSLIPQQSNLSMPLIDDSDDRTQNGSRNGHCSSSLSPASFSSMPQSPISSLSSESPPATYRSPLQEMFAASSSPPPIFKPPVRKRQTTDPRNRIEIMNRPRELLDLKLVQFDYCANDIQVRRKKSRSFNRVIKTSSLDQLLLLYNINDILARYKVQKKKGRVCIGPTKTKLCRFFKKPNRKTSSSRQSQ